MRDIQLDLKERLQFAESEKARLETEFQAEMKAVDLRYKGKTLGLMAEIEAIKSLLDIETRRTSGNQGHPAPAPVLPIKDFIIKVVRENRAKTKHEIRDLANEAGYFRKGESPGRATHGQILQLTRSGRLREKGETYAIGPDVLG